MSKRLTLDFADVVTKDYLPDWELVAIEASDLGPRLTFQKDEARFSICPETLGPLNWKEEVMKLVELAEVGEPS